MRSDGSFRLDGSLPGFNIATTLAYLQALGMVLVSLQVLKKLQEPGMGNRTKAYDLLHTDIIQAGSFSGWHVLNGGFKLLLA